MNATFLRAGLIANTAKTLSQRIRERFPKSSLYEVSEAVMELAATAEHDAPRIGRPIYWVRFAVISLIAIIAAVSTSLIVTVYSKAEQVEVVGLFDMLEGLEAGTQQFILFGFAVFFLLTVESRIKRGRALRRIHELRSLAHVIDMHQLTKDPDYYRGESADTVYSPKRELTLPELMRYLDYCSEMLSITSKIAALYIQRFSDSVVLAAVSDVETLCDGLSRKVWQKMALAEDISERRSPATMSSL